eukprot:g19416.t1
MKAFTIEYYLAIKEEAEDGDEEKEAEPKGSVVREEMGGVGHVASEAGSTLPLWRKPEQNQLNLFYTMYNDSYKFQYEMKKAYGECLHAQKNGHGHHGH